MNKKTILLFVFFLASVFVRAQISSLSYPSGYLSEEKIAAMIENSRKNGTKEAELQKHNEMLHKLLKKQNEAIANGTFDNTFGQRNNQPAQVLVAGCNNPGFEDGTTTGWTLTQASNSASASLPCPTCFTGVAGGVYQVTTIGAASTVNANAGNNTGGDASSTCDCSNSYANDCSTEPYSAAGTDRFGGFSVVAPAPLGGSHSLMINNSMCGFLMQKAAQSFVVNASNTSFTFQYAVVLQDGGHPASEAPYFIVNVTDVATGTVVPCTQYSASAEGATSGDLNGWTKSTVDESVYWYPWTTVTLDLSSMLTHTVNVAFTVSDCNAGGHFGYAYIDASCNPLQITETGGLCAGGGPAVLSGPPGMASYAWTGPVTGNTQNLSTSTSGNYTLTTTLASGCPAPLLYYNLTVSPQPVPSFTTSSPPCSGSLTFVDGSTVPTGTITNWVWNYGDGSPTVNSTTAANQTHAYATPGNYTVTLTDTTDHECVATYTFVVTAGGGGPNPIFSSNSPATAPQCLVGNNVVFTNSSTTTGSVTITGYVWNYGDGSPTVTSTTTTPNPPNHTYTAAGTYVVTLTVNVTGCSATTTETVVILPEPTASFTVPPVCVGNPSVFTSTTTNADTYSWTFGDGTGTSTVADPSYTYGSDAGSPYAVSLTVTTTGGCSVTATGSAIVSPVPVASFTVGPVCEGTASFFDATASTPSVGATYAWSFGGSAPNTDVVTVQTDNHTYSASGTFPVTLLIVVGSCSATATGSAVVNTFPVLGFTVDHPCDGTAMNITNTTTNPTTILSWNWDFGDGNTSTVNPPPAHTYTAPPGFEAAGCYPVVLTATASTGCSGTFSTTANVHPMPVPYFTGFEVCLGDSAMFTDSSFVLNPACLNDNITNWNWSFGDGNTSTSSPQTPDTLKHLYTLCGAYNITLTVTTNNNCSVSATLTGDTIYCLPTVTAPPNFSVCPGAATPNQIFTTTCQNGGTPFAVWTQFTNITGAPSLYLYPNEYADTVPSYPAVAQNLTCNILQDTVYALAVSGFGCIGNETFYLANVFPTPVVSPMPNDSACANQIVTVPNFTACPVASVITWTNSNTAVGLGAGATGNIGSFTGTNGTDSDINGVVTANGTLNGCTGPNITFTVIVNPIPSISVTPSGTYCPNTNMPQSIVTTDPVGINSYIWSVANNAAIGLPALGTGLPSVYSTPSNTTLVTQTGIVTYSIAYNGCAGTPVTQTISVYPTPYMQPISDQYWCPFDQTNPVTFATLPPSANSTYTWTYTGGGLTVTQSTLVFPSLPTSNSGSTTLPIPVNVVPSLNGCQGPDSTFTIYVYPMPQANFTANSVCLAETTLFTNTSTPIVGTNSVTTWNWDMNANGIFSALGANPQNIFLTAGTHTVTLIVTTNPNPPLTNNPMGQTGCSDTISLPVMVNPLPTPNFTADSTGCPVLTTKFIDQSSVTLGGAPYGTITNWAWVFGNGNNSTSQTPSAQTYNNLSATDPYYYDVSLTVTSASGCSKTITKQQFIEVYPVPIAAFSWNPTDADLNNPLINFTNQATGAHEYTVTTPPTYGVYGVQYYLGDNYAPNDSMNTVYNNSSFSYNYIHNQLDDAYQYYPVTQYVINQYGCTDSVTKTVEIQPVVTFYIPNSFTPNGDGKNEGFKGMGIGIDNSTYNMWVFDRWGMMIFYSVNLDTPWDGHMRGNEGAPVLQEDVYVWKVEFSDILGKPHQYHGTVTLLK